MATKQQKKDFSVPDEWRKPTFDEARNIAENQPVFPGDTLSHWTAEYCFKLGWAIRDKNGDWIPTKENPFHESVPF